MLPVPINVGCADCVLSPAGPKCASSAGSITWESVALTFSRAMASTKMGLVGHCVFSIIQRGGQWLVLRFANDPWCADLDARLSHLWC
mgnify:CR=1 FL=1